MEITLPYRWKIRPYQKGLWDYLRSGGKRAVAVWHRRAGKDELSLHHTACAAHERIGNYWHMLPEYAQARKAIWDAVNPHTGKRRVDEAFPREIRAWTREKEMMIGFLNGSTWQVVGSDNYNSLMGTTPAGMVSSEHALANPSAWGYLSPILMENNGWAIFISTPRGKNHFHDMVCHARHDAEWFCEVIGNDETGVFTKKQLDDELLRLIALHGEDYGRAIWEQEYFSSFEAAIPGAIWADCILRARTEGRIGRVDPRKDIKTHTAWDLGFTDDTVIWFYQLAGGKIYIFDVYSCAGKDIQHYADVLRHKKAEFGFEYDTHWLPHDARPRTLASGGKSTLQQLHDLNIGRCVILPRLDRQEGIQAARATFPHCLFDESRCAKGLDALSAYHREWDDETKKFSNHPEHDWSSHWADAFRYLSLSWKNPKFNKNSAESCTNTANPRYTGEMMMKRHFKRTAENRESVFS